MALGKNMLDELVGTKIIVRTVSFTYLGLLVDYDASCLKLRDASWLADTDRWGEMLADGIKQQAEVEPYPDGDDILVNRGGMADIAPWRHALPRVAQ